MGPGGILPFGNGPKSNSSKTGSRRPYLPSSGSVLGWWTIMQLFAMNSTPPIASSGYRDAGPKYAFINSVAHDG